ncbi:MAG: hypothetical protein RI977_1450, partial [Bacteroidota bacterium]
QQMHSNKEGAANGRPFLLNPIVQADYLPAGGGI